MTNLLTETKEMFAKHSLDPNDIIFIGSRITGHSCTWKEFETIADVEYDSGYGAQEVAEDLEIVFRDGTVLYRHENVGSESWAITRPFKRPLKTYPIQYLTCNLIHVGWKTLAELNDSESYEA